MNRSLPPVSVFAVRLATTRRIRPLLALTALFTALAFGAAGSRAQPAPINWVTPTAGRTDVWAGQRIIVNFNEAMDRASVEAGLSLAPPAAGRFIWQNDDRMQVEFLPREPLPPGQTLTATLATSIRTLAGAQPLSLPFQWSFAIQASPRPPDFSTGLPAQLITPSGGHGMPFEPRAPRGTFTFTLYALDTPGFIRRLAALQPNTRSAIDLAGLSPAAQWSRWIDAEAQPTEVALPPALKPGLYVLDARHPNVGNAQSLVMFTDYALVARPGRQGLTLWTSRLPSGDPGPSPNTTSSATLYGADGRVIASAAGDVSGIARFGATGGAKFAAATVAGQATVVGLDGYWYSDGYWSWQWQHQQAQALAPVFAAHIHTDRPIYRPGHTVNYKATLRKLDGDAPAVLAASTPISATIRDATNNMIRQSSLATDAFGTVAGEIKLGDEVSLGNWKVELVVGGQTLTGGFKVEEYVKPDYAVQVTPDKPFYITGETAIVKVQADYYFGQPAAGADVVVRAYRNGFYSRNNPEVERKGKLDATGGLTLVVPVQSGGESAASYTFEAEVTDASRRPVYAVAGAPVHPAAFSLGMVNRRYGIEVGQPVELEVSTMGHGGAPAAGRKVDIEMQVYDYRMGGGGYRTVRRETVTTGADGQVTARIRDLDYGWYQIRATARDDAGRQVSASSYAWLTSSRYSWYWNGGLEVKADKDSYAGGDTARLLVRSPITGTALVTIEREDVYDEIVVPVSGATPVEIPIKAAYAPGVRAKVMIWEPVDYRESYSINGMEGHLLTAEVELIIPAVDKHLSVEVIPARPSYAPGEDATFTLRVLDHAGKPVNAQIALAVVDKAVLALANDTSGDIFDAFWHPRPSFIGSYDSAQPSNWNAYRTYDRSERKWWSGPPGSATGTPMSTSTAAAAAPTAPPGTPAPGAADEPAAVAVVPRREFRDTAYWNPSIETGSDGEATITFTVPDNLTTWHALARAITVDTLAGQGMGEIVVTKAVIADPALPRFAVQGDEFVLDVLGRNYTGGPQGATCVLETPGLVQLDKGERSLDLPFNETRVARWSVVASKVGVNTVSARLITPAGTDAIELPLDVQPFGVPHRFAVAGSTSDLAIVPFDLPFKAVPEDASIEVRLTPSIATGIFDGAADLIAYPYGCVEQTMSKMLPNAVVGRLARELGIETPDSLAQLPEFMDVGLQKLYGFQLGDGSWGWWSGGRNLYITSWVLHGLTLSQQAGFKVDPGVVKRGFDWLSVAVASESDRRMQAYALYIMAEGGRADPALATRLFELRGELDSFGLGALSVTLDKVGRHDLALQVLDDLAAKVVETGDGAHWTMDMPANAGWHAYHWESMASEDKSTAMALTALAHLRPNDRLAPKAVSWLLEHRVGAGWSTDHGTAFSLLGLTDYVLAADEFRPAYDWAVLLDNALVARGRVDRSTKPGDMPTIPIGGRDLGPGEHQVTIQVQGQGRLYYTVNGRMTLFYPSFQPAKAAGLGVQLKRDYQPVAGRGGVGGWHAGDLINVRLTLTNDSELQYMLIEDKLPAGFEALNQSLNTETSQVPGQQLPWRWGGYERKEVRDDKVTFFASRLSPGTHTFEYAARAVTPGTFSARPAEAYAMYRPEVWGRSASDQVRIDVDRVAERPPLGGDFDRDCRLTGFDAALVADAWGQADSADLRERDINGDRRIDAADIATAGAHAGLECGDTVPLPPGAAGDARLHLRAPAEIAQYQTFELEIAAEAAGGSELDIGAWEATLDLPAGAFELVGMTAGNALESVRKLGPVAGSGDASGTLRLGGFVPTGVKTTGETVLAKVTLRALAGVQADIGVARAQLVTGQGGEYRVTAGGIEVSPEPWRPVGTVYLPVGER